MSCNVVSHIKRTYSHAKIGNGNKVVLARLTADLKVETMERVSISPVGEATIVKWPQNVSVEKYYIVVFVGETDEPKFNAVLHTLNNVREVRKFELAEKTVNEIRITDDAKHIEVISGKKNEVRVYNLFG
jgi:hypothetical protein